ncbi:Flavorubredoxin [Pseudobutyrivibrio sp. 49]|uniref:FprA family A-type flavoprotein n=1 Tax=unclassified Pseudobutyrivibrio TaxID=2638619 RepID=UPI00088A2118|nr:MULTISPECIES: MBL fold metallo-hydrolase [unclassified Pseudobutyrivibrio]SDI69497.1 Flavorubredoxin [Pseudobutyrivibrio sp. 49]SFO28583.1 Flavorubredoxin [Pseudobutyrivibrio sp. UC1225]
MYISDSIKYIGCNDKTIDLFESQYSVPNGVSYNSYLILDEKVAVMDTADPRVTDEWLGNLDRELAGRKPDYLVVSHMEPDHAGSIKAFLEKYPDTTVVGNAKTFTMMGQFMEAALFENRKHVVAEGDKLSLGTHELTFVFAPMVHWPEVMVEYESTEKILFSADGFGKFGALDSDEPWIDEARRYYLNIVGKYGVQVQALLKKAATLDIKTICPLHGPILTENLGYYIDLYDKWSSYKPEEEGVLITCASIHGNTKKAALKLQEKLEAAGKKTMFIDLTRDSMSEAVARAFYYDKMVCCACTYDGGLFPPMQDFLHHLTAKAYQNRKVAFVENGTWAPQAAGKMKAILEGSKNLELVEPVVSIKSTLNASSEAVMDELVKNL